MTATATATVSSLSPTTSIPAPSIPAPKAEGPLSPRSRFKGIQFVCPIPEDCYSDVINHLRQNFFADEPLNKSVELCKRGEPHAELEEHSLSTMRDMLSIVAFDAHTKEVIGVALNGVLHDSDLESGHDKISSLTDPKFRRIITLLNSVNRQLDLFKQFDLTEIFECRILSVDSDHRGQGLASELLRRSEIIAKENNFKLLKEDSTGFYSQKVAERLGLRTVYSLAYTDYTDPGTGEPVFKTSEPHRYFKVMIKELR